MENKYYLFPNSEWRHSNGYLFCGRNRVFSFDCDTSPCDEIRDASLDRIVTILNENYKKPQDDWTVINYADADSGKGCFDGKEWVFKVEWNGISWMPMHWDAKNKYWKSDVFCTIALRSQVTHYRHVPKGWLK